MLQQDLEYDPQLYQRDRGELDWDQRSVSSTTMLNDNGSVAQLNPTGRASPAPSRLAGYDRYLASGPQPEIELSRLDDQQPLLTAGVRRPPAPTSRFLTPKQVPGYFDPAMVSQTSLPGYSSEASHMHAIPLAPAVVDPELAALRLLLPRAPAPAPRALRALRAHRRPRPAPTPTPRSFTSQ